MDAVRCSRFDNDSRAADQFEVEPERVADAHDQIERRIHHARLDLGDVGTRNAHGAGESGLRDIERHPGLTAEPSEGHAKASRHAISQPNRASRSINGVFTWTARRCLVGAQPAVLERTARCRPRRHCRCERHDRDSCARPGAQWTSWCIRGDRAVLVRPRTVGELDNVALTDRVGPDRGGEGPGTAGGRAERGRTGPSRCRPRRHCRCERHDFDSCARPGAQWTSWCIRARRHPGCARGPTPAGRCGAGRPPRTRPPPRPLVR